MRRLAAVALTVCAFCALDAHAQDNDAATPAFDRPGIGFSTSTLPRGGVALELGLPSLQRDRDDTGVLATQYGTDINLRVGVSEFIELQVFGTPWNHLRLEPRDAPSSSYQGAGDSGVAVKVALPLQSEKQGLALLASTTFATGERRFTQDATQYALGASYEYAFNDRWAGALYANATRGAGADSFTWSPSLGLALTDKVGAFVEAGFTRTDGRPSTAIVGAGVTWMVTPTVQLDASFDVGLDDDSPDLLAGLGVAFYFQ